MSELHESITGCGNHGCIIRKPQGQGTNGGCTCIHRHMDTAEIRDVKGFIHWQKQRIAEFEAQLAHQRKVIEVLAEWNRELDGFYSREELIEEAEAKAKERTER